VPLPVPTTAAGVAGLRAIVAQPQWAVVAVDFDGTLAPIVDDPALARPHPDASDVLRRLAGSMRAVAVVTGRPAGVAASLLGFTAVAPPANVHITGHYGFETWTPNAGVVTGARVVTPAGHDPDLAARIDAVQSALPVLLHDVGAPPGTAIEDKGASVAVHVRRTQDPAAALELIRPALSELAATHGLWLEPGRLVLELRPSGTDKGTALTALVNAVDARAACFIGDDLGDLAAFDALDAMRARGLSALGVSSGLPGSAAAEVVARADLVLAGPDAVVAFLDSLIDAVHA
jgi:trehalose 6-phosphate phosphatase